MSGAVKKRNRSISENPRQSKINDRSKFCCYISNELGHFSMSYPKPRNFAKKVHKLMIKYPRFTSWILFAPCSCLILKEVKQLRMLIRMRENSQKGPLTTKILKGTS